MKAKQAGIVSREGAWDELGWSEARKAKERAYFDAEADDLGDAARTRAGSVMLPSDFQRRRPAASRGCSS